MRTRIVGIGLAIVSFATIPFVPFAIGQGASSARYLEQAFIRVTASASDNAKLGNYGYDTGICILGSWVKCRDDVQFWTWLKKDVNYMFVAGGDDDSQDVQLEILDEKNNLVADEKIVAPDATVTMKAPTEGWHILRLTLKRSVNNVACVCVVCILKENGHQIPIKNLDDSAGRLLRIFSDADRSLQKSGLRLEFRNARNQWGLYGAVLDQGESKTITDLDFGGNERRLLALGDKNTDDVDLYILNKAGQVVAMDNKVDREAVVIFNPVQGQRYGLKMMNFKGPGPSVIMTGVFDVLVAQKK